MVQNEELKKEYYDWMYHLVCSDKYYNKFSYKKLMQLLFSIDYFPRLDMDDNRRVDGKDFRYQFGYDNGYSDKYIEENLDTFNCTILEMMVALAYRVETRITCDQTYGDRTGQWFWTMIFSLGLSKMSDDCFDEEYCTDILYRFMDGKYMYDGRGSLFTLNDPPEDMRNVEIWCQFMWYLNETIYAN